MTPVPRSALDWEGQTVLDRGGEKIGKIEEIFLVEETGRPEWALVKIGRLGGHTTLVPLTTARPVGKGIKVDVEKDVVSKAPEVKADDEPSEQEAERLYRHYGIAIPSKPASGNGAAAAPQQQQAAPATATYASPAPSSPSPFRQPSGSGGSGGSVGSGGSGGSGDSGSGGYGDLRDAPIGDVLNTVKEEGSNLVSQELRLAKAEMSGKAKDIGIGAGMFGGAGYMASIAGIALMLTVLYALDEAMDLWLAALITTVLFAAVAAVLALSGKKKIQQAGPPIPEQTVESVKQTIQTVKEEAKWGLGQTRK